MVPKFWSLVKEKIKSGNRKLLAAMMCYLALMGAALYMLLPVHTRDDYFLLIMVLVFFTYLMIKTLSHADD